MIPVKDQGLLIPTINLYTVTDETPQPEDWVIQYVDVGQPPYERSVHKVESINEEEGLCVFVDHTVGISFCRKIIESSDKKLNLPHPFKIPHNDDSEI